MPEIPPRSASYRPLLWLLAVVLAASTTIYSGAWMFYIRHSNLPVEIGMDTLSDTSGILVTKVWSNSPAEKAGLRARDLITAIDGRSAVAPANGGDVLFQIWFQAHPGEKVALTIQRPGESQTLVIQPVFRLVRGAGDAQSLVRKGAVEIINFYPLLFLLVGIAVLFLRVEDRSAWLLALLFAGFIAEGDLPVGYAMAPDALRHFLYAYAVLMRGLLPGLFYFFFAVFPVRSPLDRKLPWLKWLLLAVGASLDWGGVTHGDWEALPFIAGLGSDAQIGLMRTIAGYGTVVLGLVSMVWNAIVAPTADDRRRLKVMRWGTLVGIAPVVLLGFGYDLAHVGLPFWANIARGIFLSLIPLSFAYAVVKHRVLDIPVLLRRSARYLLVERGFTLLMLVISISITFWFGQAFSRHFSAGSKTAIPIGATFGVLLIAGAIEVHRQVRTRLDRAFFRSAYDAQQILENLSATALTVTDRQALAALLHQQIDEALHPMPLGIYLLAKDNQLREYACRNPEQPQTLSLPEATRKKLAAARTPLEAGYDGSRATLFDRLHAECLVPIAGSVAGELQGLIVLGERLSEEPYSAGDKRLLGSVASHAGIAMRSITLAEKMADRMEAERRSEQEMQIARQVQSRLLPQESPQLPTLDCAGECIQTRAVGGDYYDFLDFCSGKLGIVLADISGKGISGALLMANLQASLRGQYALALENIPRLLRSVNSLFYKNTETNHYATMFFSIYDDASRTLRYVNCGHNPPILLRATGEVERLNATATVLGLFEEWDCEVAEKRLGAGDVLLVYTDGISEAAPSDDAPEFGEARLIEAMKNLRDRSARAMMDEIIAEVQRFSQGEQADDMTLIVARCR
ncbi:MAG: SpoIIE family protein phosphatase [Candidatus Sulfotelmatobacter sp.]